MWCKADNLAISKYDSYMKKVTVRLPWNSMSRIFILKLFFHPKFIKLKIN
jgi:hypothetical protein